MLRWKREQLLVGERADCVANENKGWKGVSKSVRGIGERR